MASTTRTWIDAWRTEQHLTNLNSAIGAFEVAASPKRPIHEIHLLSWSKVYVLLDPTAWGTLCDPAPCGARRGEVVVDDPRVWLESCEVAGLLTLLWMAEVTQMNCKQGSYSLKSLKHTPSRPLNCACRRDVYNGSFQYSSAPFVSRHWGKMPHVGRSSAKEPKHMADTEERLAERRFHPVVQLTAPSPEGCCVAAIAELAFAAQRSCGVISTALHLLLAACFHVPAASEVVPHVVETSVSAPPTVVAWEKTGVGRSDTEVVDAVEDASGKSPKKRKLCTLCCVDDSRSMGSTPPALRTCIPSLELCALTGNPWRGPPIS